jgi:hypothetical protein
MDTILSLDTIVHIHSYMLHNEEVAFSKPEFSPHRIPQERSRSYFKPQLPLWSFVPFRTSPSNIDHLSCPVQRIE